MSYFKECEQYGLEMHRKLIEMRNRGHDGLQFFNYAKEYFYGQMVLHELIPAFSKVYDILTEKNHIGHKNRIVLGDYDEGVWIEKCNKQVIVTTRYCSTADDNNTIYVYDKRFETPLLKYFAVVTAWPRQQKYSKKWNIEGVKIPSIGTHRRNNFTFRYNDSRDKGFVLRYEFFRKAVNDCYNERDIPFVINKMNYILCDLGDMYGR